MSFPKLCHCCQRSHSAAEWAGLPYAGDKSRRGVQATEEGVLVLRQCPCTSTLAVSEADDRLAEAERRKREDEYLAKLRADLRAGRVREAEQSLRTRTAKLGRAS